MRPSASAQLFVKAAVRSLARIGRDWVVTISELPLVPLVMLPNRSATTTVPLAAEHSASNATREVVESELPALEPRPRTLVTAA